MGSSLEDDKEGRDSLLRAERRKNDLDPKCKKEAELEELLLTYRNREDLRERINLFLSSLLKNGCTEEDRDASQEEAV